MITFARRNRLLLAFVVATGVLADATVLLRSFFHSESAP